MRFAYGLAGEGRGHTTRAIGLGVQLLEAGHDVMFFTDGDALKLIRERFGEERVAIMPVPRFLYGKRGVQLIRSGFKNAGFLFRRKPKAKAVIAAMGDWRPDAVICDFEPTMWAVARKLKVPFITFDSQRFAVACKLRKVLPIVHRLLLLPIIGAVWFFAPRTNLAIISKPFDLPMSPRRRHTHLVGPILRDSIRDKTWQPSGEHILCYLRGRTESILRPLDALAGELGLRVKLYGKQPDPDLQHIDECEISEEGFAKHMSTAEFVISTAGTQVIGEVAHFSVPTVLVPEPGQIEQDINAVIAERVVATIRRRKVKKIKMIDFKEDIERMRGLKSTSFEDGSVAACRLIVQWMDSRMNNV